MSMNHQLAEKNNKLGSIYYQDQFDAFDDNVLSPSYEHPKVARQAYQRASLEWESKVSTATVSTVVLILGAGILIPILITLAFSP